MNTIDLKLETKTKNYQILIGKGLLSDEQAFAPVIKGQQVFIVSNDTVAPIYLDTLKNTLSSYELFEFILEDGEQHKTFANYQRILDRMLDIGLRRNATLVALGGGVVGDMAGFSAATYQRGIPFIQVPTTILSQVDSSVGGKTAVNHPKGKNMIGAFHQPVRVITDIETLTTLPARELGAGIAEVIKAAIILDADFFTWLESSAQQILAGDEAKIVAMIERSCRIKANIVSQDETEQGVRAWLNLGHTFGHAIERCLGYGQLLHGEAVAIGIIMAADFAAEQRMLSIEQCHRINRLIAAFELPTSLKDNNNQVTASDLVQAMALDKKNIDADLTLVLPKAIGEVTIKHSVKSQDIEKFLGRYFI